jgi:hypothetical protein
MRERLEATARNNLPRLLALALLALVIGWVASASLLDKRWYEVVMDVLPYSFVCLLMVRMPVILSRIAKRMRDYERSVGEDPDVPIIDQEGDGPTALAL